MGSGATWPRRRVTLQVVDVGEHLDGADAVGDRVAQVQHRRGASVGEPLDEGRGPQRPGDVHRRLQGDLGHVDHLRAGCPVAGTRTRRTWKSRLKSGSTTHRGAAVGSVGMTTF